MKKILLISACMAGDPVRYDGQGKGLSTATLNALKTRFELQPVCPECLGGLSTPRPPAEIEPGGTASEVCQGQARVIAKTGEDVTEAFREGARLTLACARTHGATVALLKANSPSCGNHAVYDGQFAGQLVKGEGATAHHLRCAGISVFNENELDGLLGTL